jgi:peptidyl-prolyl cis-trans isomerase SurA
MKKSIYFFLLLILFPFVASGQDEVLLTIDNQPVLRSDFERIYHKNNEIQGYDNKSAADYLEMFINFKLKVYEAEKEGYDTLSSFRKELAGYREQLSRPYLQDIKLVDQLVKEAYYRTVNEVNASHIMVKVAAKASPADTLAAYNKAMDIRKRLVAGESFEKIALNESDDPSAKSNAGDLGWFYAFSMVYPFENAAYNTNVGDYSMPVRTRYGYHIIRVNDKRPALGEIKLAHILIRADRNQKPEEVNQALEKIKTCYRLLNEGKSFTEVVKQYSEDAGSAQIGGQMRWIRSGELPLNIENKVFALTDSGSFTGPLRSDYGWHIFQLQSKRPLPAFDQAKSQIEEKVMMDERGKKAEKTFIAGLKKDLDFQSFPQNITLLAAIMDSSVYSGNWNPASTENLSNPVFVIKDKQYSQMDLVNYINKTKRYSPKSSFSDIANNKCDEMVKKELFENEKQQLDAKYPSFKYLMEEYHDGILLFNIMDKNIWTKAVNDSTGLRKYYGDHTGDYQWKERADVSVYTVKDEKLLKTAKKAAVIRTKKNWTSDEYVKQVCGNDSVKCVQVSDYKIEQGEKAPFGDFEWKKGSVQSQAVGSINRIVVVNNIIALGPKVFNEVQGQVTSDYQNFLDKKWIEELRAKYPVVINKDVLQKVQ